MAIDKNAAMELKKVITPEGRGSYLHLAEPQEYEGKVSYSMVFVWDKKVDLKAVKQAAYNAVKEKYGSLDKRPPGFIFPWKDGDGVKTDGSARQEEYKGCTFMTTSCKKRPKVIGRKSGVEILDVADTCKPGHWYKGNLIAFCYPMDEKDKRSKRGVGFALLAVQHVRADEEFGGGGNRAASEFDDIADDSNDADNYSNGDAESENDSDNGEEFDLS